MRALVTGACGFVGGYLVRRLVESGDAVVGTTLPGLPARTYACETMPLDVTDPEACRRAVREIAPDVVYHLAGMAFVPEAESDFARALAINVGGPDNIIRACVESGRPATVLVVSSADLYGRIAAADLPLSETTIIRPANNYGLTKALAELVPARYAAASQVRTVIARPFNHIGPGQNERFVTSNFARQIALIAAGKAEPILRVGNLDARRDFTDVRDIVAGYQLAALKGRGTYAFCSGAAVSIRSILEKLISIAGVEVTIELDPARLRPSDTPELYGSFAKAERELGWRPKMTLDQTLADIYAAWRRVVSEGPR